MSITIELTRVIQESHSFDVADDADPIKIFNDIRRDPHLLWTNFNTDLDASDDVDETVSEVLDFSVEDE